MQNSPNSDPLAGLLLSSAAAISPAGARQAKHYDRVAEEYLTNLTYPHTQAYMSYLDESLLAAIGPGSLGVTAEVCCGHGEAMALLTDRITLGIGVDVSSAMLKSAASRLGGAKFRFLNADATMMPLKDSSLDTVLMFGGIHHVPDRQKLFREVARVLKPGGRLIFREPVSDFFLWRWLRAIVYRLSPSLDHSTERPLTFAETAPYLEAAGLRLTYWHTFGFIGFCMFMNSDILKFNKLFRLIPGIRTVVALTARLDDFMVRSLAPKSLGLQVVGIAIKD